MKNLIYYLTLISLITLIGNSSAQSLADLDKRNGFKELKLGDSYNKWAKDLVKLSSNKYAKPGESFFRYRGNCCLKIFEFDVKEIVLTFNEDKIIRIYIQLVNFQKFYNRDHTIGFSKTGGYEKLNSKFTSLFGKPSGSYMPEDGTPYHIQTGWFGQEVYLKTYYKYIGTKEGEYAIVDILSAKYAKQNLENGF